MKRWTTLLPLLWFYNIAEAAPSSTSTNIVYLNSTVIEETSCRMIEPEITGADEHTGFLIISQFCRIPKCDAFRDTRALIVLLYRKPSGADFEITVYRDNVEQPPFADRDVGPDFGNALEFALNALHQNTVTKKEPDNSLPIWLIVIAATVGVVLAGIGIVYCWRKKKARADLERGQSNIPGTSEHLSGSPISASSRNSTSSRSTSLPANRRSKHRRRRSSKSRNESRRRRLSKKSTAKTNNVKEELSNISHRQACAAVEKAINRSLATPVPRPMADRIDNPVSTDEFVVCMRKMVEFCVGYVTNSARYRVTTDSKPGSLFNALPSRAPENPDGFDDIMGDVKTTIMQAMSHWRHPRFYAYSIGQSFPDVIAETLIATLSTSGFSWFANPALTEMEFAMVNWLGRAFDLPQSFLYPSTCNAQSSGGGHLVDSASDASFSALIAARQKKIDELVAKWKLEQANLSPEKRENKNEQQLKGEILAKLVTYGSRESNSCFEKACGIGAVNYRAITTKEKDNYVMTKDDLEAEINKDLAKGFIPFFVHVTVETTGADVLSGIVELKDKHGVWIHVDAAYVGNFWVNPEHRVNQKGIEHVDSINVNLHKNSLTSPPCGVLWTQHPVLFKKPFMMNASKESNDLRDWGLQLTRRFKALKVYFLFRMFGINGLRRHNEKVLAAAHRLETKMLTLRHIRKIGSTNLGVFCVRYHEDGKDDEYLDVCTRQLAQYVNDSHELCFTLTTIGERDAIRVSTSCPNVEYADEAVFVFGVLLKEFTEKKKVPLFLTNVRANPSFFRSPSIAFDEHVIGSPAVSLCGSAMSVNTSPGSPNPNKLLEHKEKSPIEPSTDSKSDARGGNIAKDEKQSRTTSFPVPPARSPLPRPEDSLSTFSKS